MTQRRTVLETTVQLLRVAGGPTNRRQVSEAIYRDELLTTSFVLREFIRTIIKDVTYVHSVVNRLDASLDGRLALANLDLFLASGLGNFSVRFGRRERYVTAAILAGFRSTSVSKVRLLTRLERMGEQWVRDFFEMDSPLGGTIKVSCLCSLDDDHLQLTALTQGTPFPDQPVFPSRASSFLEEHRDEVAGVATAMAQAPSRRKDKLLLGILAKLRDDGGVYQFSRLTPKTRGNWHLGDLLIALESPSDCTVLSLDRHFEVLCPALRRELRLFP